MSLPIITGEFGVVQEPDMRFGDDGRPWLKIRGKAADRKFNADTKEWSDGDPCFVDIVVGGKIAENLMDSITTGDTIIVSGKLTQREWESDGKKQKAYSIRADSAGVSTRFTPAKTPKAGGNSSAAPVAAASFDEGAPF